MDNPFQAFYQEDIAIAHKDKRRTIYSPSEIINSRGADLHWHSVIGIHNNLDPLPLGNHHHDYREIYFTPTSGLIVHLVDIKDSQKRGSFVMAPGSRLSIPEYTAHKVDASPGSVLMVWGSVPFDPQRIIKSPDHILEILASMN